MINHNWVFGNGAGINFQNGVNTFTAAFNGTISMNTDEGCASISDGNGNLLFYTDGKSLWNGNHALAISDLGLTGNKSATQSAIIVPAPGSKETFYIFTVGAESNSDFYVSQLNAAKVWRDSFGNWQMEPVDNVNGYDNPVPTGVNRHFTERLTAVQFPDCSGAWVLTTVRTSMSNLVGSSMVSSTFKGQSVNGRCDYGYYQGDGMIRIFKVDAQGVSFHLDIPLLSFREPIPISHHGYLRVSPDKKQVAFANGLLENIILMDFDVITGTPGNARVIHLDRNLIANTAIPDLASTISTDYDLIVYGLEFSPDSRTLYFSVNTHNGGALEVFGDPATVAGFIVGVDLNQTQLTQQVVACERAGRNGRYTFGALQLGPDGVIYVARDMEIHMGAIYSANDLPNSHYNFTAVRLPDGVNCTLGIPNLLPTPCPVNDCNCNEDHECDCGCSGCNEDAKAQNEELLKQAIGKSKDVRWGKNAPARIEQVTCSPALNKDPSITPYFYFSWGDDAGDRIEENDTEIVYITVCNPYNDLEFKGVRINKISITTQSDEEKMRIVPDCLVTIDCLPPCTSISREFTLLTRSNGLSGLHLLEMDFCIDEVVLRNRDFAGKATFRFSVTKG